MIPGYIRPTCNNNGIVGLKLELKHTCSIAIDHCTSVVFSVYACTGSVAVNTDLSLV